MMVFFISSNISATTQALSHDNQALSKLNEAGKKFNLYFPPTWPPRSLNIPLKSAEKSAIENMAKALSDYLTSEKINNALGDDGHTVTISPSDSSDLNKMALKLLQDDIRLAYDALYFAANPFSSGTFNEDQKQMLISHSAIKNPKLLNDVMSHELVHVETSMKRRKSLASLFYCKFTGKQFDPHYLSCDEMNAYHHDLSKLPHKNEYDGQIESKILSAKNHTIPIPSLIENLDMASMKVEGETVMIKGKNKDGAYQIEFPTVSIVNSNRAMGERVRIYLDLLKMQAKDYSAYISDLEAKNSPEKYSK